MEPRAREVYALNHGVPETEIAGDITKVDASDIPDHDLLLGGFPCQAFTVVGQRRGFDEARGTLFFDVVRILDAKRPSAFILENVKGLLSHDGGNTFKVIYRTLRELGYRVSVRTICASGWVAQRRRRVYITGHLSDPRWNLDFMNVPEPGSGPRLGSVLDDDFPADAVLTDGTWKHIRERTGTWARYTVATKDDVGGTLTALYNKSDNGKHLLIATPDGNPRILTPTECVRYMGFPETFRVPVPKKDAYRLLGNAVVPPVISAIASHLFGGEVA